MMGCALLQKQASLDLELSAHVWKRLVCQALDPTDLVEYDEAEFTSLQRLRHIDVTAARDRRM